MYNNFAEYYDRLMYDADYVGRCDELCRLFEKYDRMPSLLLDLACGTGNFSTQMAKRGVSVIGVDISPEMLGVAKEKSANEGLDILYLCQDASRLDLYGTVDGAICCLDSVNHITDYETLCKAFARVSLFLEKDRLFIFDVNTCYKHENVLADNVFVFEEEGVFCVWSNEYDPQKRLSTIMLDFFEEDADGRYIRSFDTIDERAYTDDELQKAINDAGLEIVARLGEFSDTQPQADTERVVYVTRKV